MNGKADYVRRQFETRGHQCHWPGCEKAVPPAKWGCKAHWFRLPPEIRSAIWQAYEPGQEISKRPSRQYVEAAQAAQVWIAKHLGRKAAGPEQGRLF